MPTANPRINVTLSPSLDALVGRLAVAQRVSKAHVLRELLEAAEPALQRTVALMEAAFQAADKSRDELRAKLDAVLDVAEASVAQVVEQMDRSTADLVASAEAVKGRRPRRMAPGTGAAGAADGTLARGTRKGSAAGAVASDPPPSKRGVKSSGKGG